MRRNFFGQVFGGLLVAMGLRKAPKPVPLLFHRDAFSMSWPIPKSYEQRLQDGYDDLGKTFGLRRECSPEEAEQWRAAAAAIRRAQEL